LGRASRRNHRAVTIGQAKSGQIIAAAASIMIVVFGSFLFGGSRVLLVISSPPSRAQMVTDTLPGT
jgi:hypothetical protein